MGVYFGLMPLAEFFSPFKSTVLGIHSCAFDASTIVFIVYMVQIKKNFFNQSIENLSFYEIVILFIFCTLYHYTHDGNCWNSVLASKIEKIK